MAIADMSKLLLIGNNNERSALIRILHRAGCVEITQTAEHANTSHMTDADAQDKIAYKLARLEFYFDTLRAYRSQAVKATKDKITQVGYEPKKGGMFTPKPSLTFEQLMQTPDCEEAVFDEIARMQEHVDELTQSRARRAKLVAMRDQLRPFQAMPIAMNRIVDTKTVAVLCGYVAASKAEKLAQLDELGAVWEAYPSASFVALVVLVGKERADEVRNYLSELEFTPLTFRDAETPAQRIQQCEDEIRAEDVATADRVCTMMQSERIMQDARRLHDYYTIEARKLECGSMTVSTRSSYILEAWVPSAAKEKLDQTLDQSELTLAYLIRDPEQGEIPPTLCVNNGVVTPYESVTNMFSAPEYKEIDPNPFVTFFFFLFFGMMVSDAGYGLLLTLGTGIILWKTRPPKGYSNLIKIIFMGGISTLLWGMVFGSYFGFSAKDIGIPYWFNPIEEPMMMLYLSLAMGLFQMCFGLGIHMVALIRAHKPWEGFCSAFSWYFILLGLAGGAVGGKLASWLPTVGWSVFGVGIVLLMLSGAFGKKGAKKATGALGSLYGIINFFSDLMSYTRIFGLGLATAVIGMVFNQIGQVIYGLIPVKFLGAIAFGVIFLIGHVFNVGINTLGAYVHNSRLQFVEFFGKFYAGGGRLFRPLGSEMKYYYIKPQEVTKQ